LSIAEQRAVGFILAWSLASLQKTIISKGSGEAKVDQSLMQVLLPLPASLL